MIEVLSIVPVLFAADLLMKYGYGIEAKPKRWWALSPSSACALIGWEGALITKFLLGH